MHKSSFESFVGAAIFATSLQRFDKNHPEKIFTRWRVIMFLLAGRWASHFTISQIIYRQDSPSWWYSPWRFYHSVAEHLPQDFAAELCRRGVDEMVLSHYNAGRRKRSENARGNGRRMGKGGNRPDRHRHSGTRCRTEERFCPPWCVLLWQEPDFRLLEFPSATLWILLWFNISTNIKRMQHLYKEKTFYSRY